MLTAAEVKQLKEENYSNDFVRRLTQENIPAAKSSVSMAFDFLSVVFARPVISAVTAIILVGSITIALIVNKPVQRNYSTAADNSDVIRAEEQAKYALSIVDNIFKKTSSTLQKEILGEKVTKPIKESVGIVNNILKGEKNETN
jgi:hypothetical protein